MDEKRVAQLVVDVAKRLLELSKIGYNDDGSVRVLTPDEQKDTERKLSAWLRQYVLVYKHYNAGVTPKVADMIQKLRSVVEDLSSVFTLAEPLDIHAPSVLQKVADEAWGDDPNPPWFVADQWFRWLKHESNEDLVMFLEHFKHHEAGEEYQSRWSFMFQ